MFKMSTSDKDTKYIYVYIYKNSKSYKAAINTHAFSEGNYLPWEVPGNLPNNVLGRIKQTLFTLPPSPPPLNNESGLPQ